MQVEKLIDELREKSDSESFDDEKEKLLNIKKAREAEMLMEKLKNAEVQLKLNKSDNEASLKRIEDNLQFSRDSNQNLKSDYDLLTEKMAKIQKTNNNQIMELKEEIEEYCQKLTKLQIQNDDAENDKAKAMDK